MDYATHYDVGDRKREGGINEDSVAVSVFEHGHREGFRGYDRERAAGETDTGAAGAETDVDGDGAGNTGTSAGRDAGRSGDTAAGAEGDERTDRPTHDTRSAAVFALADGAGGHDAGDVASYIATTAVCEHLAGTAVDAARSDPSGFGVAVDDPLPASPRAADLELAVAEAVVAAHREVLRYAAECDQQAHATVVAGVCVGGRCHYGWVGDSRAYLVNGARREIVPLTTDHSVVQRLRDAEDIDDVEALVHPRGNEITRALGGSGREDPETATVDVETETVPLYREDVLLATSDGLVDAQTEAAKLYEWYHDTDRDGEVADIVRDRAVTDEEIRDRVLSANSLDGAATALLGLANDRGGKDNLSTVLLRDETLPETPDDPPSRAIDAEPAVRDRQTVVGERN